MKSIQHFLRQQIKAVLGGTIDVNDEDIIFTLPPQRKFGDLSSTLPFQIAKKIKQKPAEIAQHLVDLLQNQIPFISEIKLAGPGFLNFFFKKDYLFNYLIEHLSRLPEKKEEKVVVEHTSINPNKSAHIGHLRNACLGDTLVQLLRFLGYIVEVQNYIDDTGIQMADVVWGLLYNQKKDLSEVKKIKNLASYLWSLYTEVNQRFGQDEQYKNERNEVHKKIEDKINPEYDICDYISQEVLKDHLMVMNYLNIRYDLLVRESDIIKLNFFTDTQQLLKQKSIMYKSNDPSKEGCWVINYRAENIEKIIIRSNNTITYIGKDIAYSFWKLGLGQGDFFYRLFFIYPDQKEIYITDARAKEKRTGYGQASKVYNVIDVRQSYLQNIISQVVEDLGGEKTSRFHHFSYEMVALTPKCVKELGIPLSPEDENKSYIEVSGRKGMAIKADDLMRKLEEKSLLEVKKRHPQLNNDECVPIARDIAVGALRYFMIKYSSNSVIAFDFDEVLSFEGDTGPYLQYTLVRINSILRKNDSTLDQPDMRFLDTSELSPEEFIVFYEMLLNFSLLEVEMEFALSQHEISHITTYTYKLCQQFNHYYHLYPILSEKNLEIKRIRMNLIFLVRKKLEILFSLMGIPVPIQM